MYRDDTCAVCGESLPPDHFYCREHAATVDDRLHRIGDLIVAVTRDAGRLAQLVRQVADETWDYLAEQEDDDPSWPPAARLQLRTDADDVTVDVDSEPGRVRVDMTLPLADALNALSDDLASPSWRRLAAAASEASGANATH